MPVNEFEQHVQQKMDELQFRPSPIIWEEVEKRIRKEKKRRRFILWFFIFGALLLAGSGWWLTNTGHKKDHAEATVAQTITPAKTNEITQSKPETTAQQQTTTVSIRKKEELPSLSGKTLITVPPSVTVAEKKKTITWPDKEPGKENVQIARTVKKNTKEKGIQEKTNVTKTTNQPMSVTEEDGSLIDITRNQPAKNKNIQTAGIDSVTNTTDSNKNITANTDEDKKEGQQIPVIKDSSLTKQTEEAPKKTISITTKKKWELGITASVGQAGLSNGFSFFGSQKDAYVFANQSNTATGGSGPLAPAIVAVPGNGFSWQLGSYVKRSFNKRTGMSAGLNIASYSTVQKTGVFVDSTGRFSTGLISSLSSGYYRNGSAVSNKNHYYYLEIPLSFEWQINKGTKLPVIFKNGFSIGYFMGSDALVYSDISNVFYKNNKLLNKTTIAYQTGLYTNLFKLSKHPITAGILFKYHFNKLQKISSSNENHLSSFGFQLGWQLKK